MEQHKNKYWRILLNEKILFYVDGGNEIVAMENIRKAIDLINNAKITDKISIQTYSEECGFYTIDQNGR